MKNVCFIYLTCLSLNTLVANLLYFATSMCDCKFVECYVFFDEKIHVTLFFGRKNYYLPI